MNIILRSICLFLQLYYLFQIFNSTDINKIEKSRQNIFIFGICGTCMAHIIEIPDIQLDEMAWFLIN